MERLTKLINGVIVYVGTDNPYPTGQIPCEGSPQGVREIMGHLAAYEETERTPEEVTALGKLFDYALEESKTLTEQLALLNRIRDLAEADRDGRVVVLPVRPVLTQSIGSMLYIIEDGEIVEDSLCEALVGMGSNGEINIFYTTLSDQISFEQADIGKTVFLTREEAEKVLGAIKDE